jgi:hypothetical protein
MTDLEAQGKFAAALAEFQKTKPCAAFEDEADVFDAIHPVHTLGFSWSLVRSNETMYVHVMHSGGWRMTSTFPVNEVKDLYIILGAMFGVLGNDAEPNNPTAKPAIIEPLPADKPLTVCSVPSKSAQESEPYSDPAPAKPATIEPVDFIGEGSPDTSVLPEDLVVLSSSERETCLAMIRALHPDHRKVFQVTFRSHFNIDKSQRVVSPHITQVQHKKFIESFVNELEGIAA